MSDEDRSDEGQSDEDQEEPSTLIAYAVSDCIDAVGMIASPRVWRWQCATKTAEARKQLITAALARLAKVAPLLDLPNVMGPKDELRRAAAIAADLERAITTWDADREPPPPLVRLAWDFFACLGVPEGHEFQLPGDPRGE